MATVINGKVVKYEDEDIDVFKFLDFNPVD